MKIKAALFDLDRTIVDMGDYIDWEAARNDIAEVYSKHGVPRNIVTLTDNATLLFARMYAELAGILPQSRIIEVQRKASEVFEGHEMRGIAHLTIRHGCVETLRWIKNRGIGIGVISSNGERIVREALENTGLNKFVDVSFSRDSPGRPKPYPDHVLRCLSALHSKAGDSIMVGDRILDVVAAREAGVLAIGLSSGYHSPEDLLEAGAHRVLKALSELPPLITALEVGK